MKRLVKNCIARLAALVALGASKRKSHIIFWRRGKMYVDLGDARGRFLIKKFGATQPALTLVWHRLAHYLRPGLVLDIGANYGEISFSKRYVSGTRVFLFEPNPALHSYL